ncbi:amino acid permease [Lactococcus formosensis]|jgi:Amino acid transporters|uniref:Amino acid permease n=1 Tax=Lactococcus formosensis TaxID=1281486 RepID=A0A9Q9D6M4_9LACT|nr:amino acid permease [Lactococcus formosensis]MDG6127138.1 amino acid permease [Lactococcus formosensis]MDG6143624.1 amino acid permease [Lactococcus formosensis]MDG6156704.1 amino acid permease [Lactococcus formosensis]MDG6160932.1 amino acid permease [Lactococcus formosensis]MDG6167229.1 amino acid permease [Lactococcus formosensis]
MDNTSNNEGTPSTQVKRGLKHRHLTMIALGGTIGTGLFVASGATISQAGPLGALVAYIAIGLMVFFLMTSLGEMASYLPVSGSFASFADRYVDKAFGFAMGWNYWFNSAITVAVEAATVGVIMQFWLPHVPTWIWSTIVIALILLVNLISAKAYGEAEFWMATIKVIAVIAFIVIGLATIFGVMSYKPDVARNLSAGGNHGFVGGIGGMIAVFMIAGFSFQGTEIVGIAAGESENPEKNVPSAIKQVFWRIIIFYFLSIFVIGALVYYKDPSLLRAATQSDITVSPFTLVFERAGLAAAASVMNAVILTSVISSANSWLYAASRMLFGMAKEGHAPKIFAKTNTSNGVPIYAILATVAIGLLAFLTSIFGTEIYFYLVAASGLSGFLAWIGIAICHFRFRRAFIKQGHKLSELGYHAKWFPIGPIIALILSIIIVIGQITTVTMNAQSIITTYLALPLFLILYFSYKIVKKTKLIPLEEVDLSRDID